MADNAIDNIIIKHTDHSIADYTGASIQSVLTHNKTKLTYKLTLFFGYNKSKNSISKTLEITQEQYLALNKMINDKNNKLIKTSKQVLSDDELFGVTTSLRTLDDPTNTNTTTLNTINTTTNTKAVNLINQFDDELRPSVELIIEHRTQMNKPITKRGIDMLIKKLKAYAEHWDISNRDALDFWLGENWQGIDVEYKYPFRKTDKDKPQSFAEIKKMVNKEQKKPMTLQQLKRMALEEAS
jgi:hypothetical protein